MYTRRHVYTKSHKDGRILRKSSDVVFALLVSIICFVICTIYITDKLRAWDARRAPKMNKNTFKELGVDDVIKGPHSKHIKADDYQPWEPFANSHESRPYEVVDCPPTPDPDYPKAYSMYHEILKNWNADSTVIPAFHYDSLCHFDFQNETQRTIALAYREAERPFIGYNIEEIDNVANKWGDLEYLSRKLGHKPYRTETSKTNHFMYWSGPKNHHRLRNGQLWSPPTDVIQTTFQEWVDLAIQGQNETLEDRKHEYFRVSSDMNNDWLFDELPFFKPKPSMFIVDPAEQRGIHCRFGMRGVTAEAHFDAGRNAVVMLGGMRRWILAHPNQCEHMHMLPRGHPSGRHSEVHWPNPDLNQFPNFEKVRGNEVILTPGDFLYVPNYWLHYIVSLNVNYQCNSRSGVSPHFDDDIRRCGF